MGKGRAVSISLLVAYTVAMIAFALGGKSLINLPGLSAYELLTESRLSRWLALAALQIGVEAGRFFPIGFFVPALFPEPSSKLKELGIRLFLAFPVTVVLIGFVRGFELGGGWQLPGPIDVLLPLVGGAFGIWVGANWKRGWSARGWLVPKLALFASIIIGTGLYLFSYGTDTEALDFASPTVTSVEKQNVWGKISAARRKTRQDPDAATELLLDSHDLSILLNWGFSLFPHEIHSRVDLLPGAVTTQVSIKLPKFRGHERYFNFIAGSSAEAQGGRLKLRLTGVQFGKVVFPDWLLNASSYLLRSFIENDRRVRPILNAADRFELTEKEMTLVYHEAQISKTHLATLFGGGTSPELVEACRSHIDNLIARGAAVRGAGGNERAAMALKTVFQYAKQRSVDHDPVVENRAAIITMNMAWGDVAIARFVGDIADDKKRKELRESVGTIEIRGKANWTEDFFLAAAILVTSSEGMADAASVLKEELDRKAKSGVRMFSFGDLLARKTGTRLAEVATRDGKSARMIQDRASGNLTLDDFYPSTESMHQDLQGDQELVTAKGKTQGKAFDAFVKEIEKRLDRCPLYKE